jgi:hypothetical protein
MIEVTADQVRKNIGGDLAAIKAALETINASVPLPLLLAVPVALPKTEAVTPQAGRNSSAYVDVCCRPPLA